MNKQLAYIFPVTQSCTEVAEGLFYTFNFSRLGCNSN